MRQTTQNKNIRFINDLLKNYKILAFNKSAYGRYDIGQMIPVDEIPIDLEEDTIMEYLNDAIETIKAYPGRGELYSNIIQDSYINDAPVEEQMCKEKYDICFSTFIKYRQQAIEIIATIFYGKATGREVSNEKETSDLYGATAQ